jgi:phospholipid/cholesterol/gamma-HCH transport system substrate-binding protein
MSKELKVGAFVLASLLIALGTLVYVANVQLRGARVPYKTYFRFAGGLETGSIVRFGGITEGSVTAVHPWREDPTKIEILLEIREGIPVNGDSTALLTAVSPLGNKYLEITTGTSTAPRLPPGATIRSAEAVSLDDIAKQVSAIATTTQSTLQNVQKDIDQLTGDAHVVLTNAQSLTGPRNQENIAALLADMRELVDKESPRIDNVLENLQLASSHASDALAEIDTASQTANATIANANRSIDEIREPLKKDLAELQRTMTDARHLMANLDTVVSANERNIDDILENFRVTSENLRELTASVKQRPWTLIRAKPAPDRAVPVVTGGR